MSAKLRDCAVCTAPARYRYFGVITCESCKQFFRRNATNLKNHVCAQNERCQLVSKGARCPKCRLTKCFKVGMKPIEYEGDSEQNECIEGKQGTAEQRSSVIRKNPYPRKLVAGGEQDTQNFDIISRQCRKNQSTKVRHEIGIQTNLCGLVTAIPCDKSKSEEQKQSTQPEHNDTTKTVAPNSLFSNLETVLHNGEQQVLLPIKNCRSLLSAAEGPSSSSSPIEVTRKIEVVNMAAYEKLLEAWQNSLQAGGGLQKFDCNNLASAMPSTHAILRDNSIPHDLPPAKLQQVGITLLREGGELGQMISPICGPNPGYQLSNAEYLALVLVKEAFSGLDEYVDNEKAKLLLKNEHSSTDIWKIMAISIDRIVTMAKKLPAFNSLSENGQLSVLRAGMIKMLTLHGVSRFDEGVRAWTTPTIDGANARVSINMFRTLHGELKDERTHGFMELYESMLPEIRSNELAIRLLMVIALFSPNLADISDPTDKEVILKNYGEYSTLLHRYLQSLHGPRGIQLTDKIFKALELLNYQCKFTADLFINRIPSCEIGGLPSEFFKVNPTE